MNHHIEPESTPKEYAKLVGVVLGIVLLAWATAAQWGGLTVPNFLRMFMGWFFLVFALFKLADLKGFAMAYMGYDVVAKRWAGYAYAYPFIELALSAGNFFAVSYADWATLAVMAVSSIGVVRELLRGSKIKCACLGTYIKLPLTTVSLVEDLGMGAMAAFMLFI